MFPANFDESTRAVDGFGSVEPLCVVDCLSLSGEASVISCWKMTKSELAEFARTGRIWLLMKGTVMHPVSLTAESPFIERV